MAEFDTRSELELTFEYQLNVSGIGNYVTEYRFDPKRRWRADFAWPSQRLLVEIEGGTWARGRHSRGAGYAADCEKYNAATLQGWRVLRFTCEMIEDGTALQTLINALNFQQNT